MDNQKGNKWGQALGEVHRKREEKNVIVKHQKTKNQKSEKVTITELKKKLDHLGITYKKSAKKTELLALLNKKPIQQTLSGKIIRLDEFQGGKMIDLGPLGKYEVRKPSEISIDLTVHRYGE